MRGRKDSSGSEASDIDAFTRGLDLALRDSFDSEESTILIMEETPISQFTVPQVPNTLDLKRTARSAGDKRPKKIVKFPQIAPTAGSSKRGKPSPNTLITAPANPSSAMPSDQPMSASSYEISSQFLEAWKGGHPDLLEGTAQIKTQWTSDNWGGLINPTSKVNISMFVWALDANSGNSLNREKILDAYAHLLVAKSLSKNINLSERTTTIMELINLPSVVGSKSSGTSGFETLALHIEKLVSEMSSTQRDFTEASHIKMGEQIAAFQAFIRDSSAGHIASMNLILKTVEVIGGKTALELAKLNKGVSQAVPSPAASKSGAMSSIPSSAGRAIARAPTSVSSLTETHLPLPSLADRLSKIKSAKQQERNPDKST